MMDTSGGVANAENKTASHQPVANVGMALREAREALGLSVHDIANRIKFAPRQVEALEANDFANLPQATFLRGFVRSYARVLQLDEAALIAALPIEAGSHVASRAQVVDVAFPTLISLQRVNLLWIAGALGVVLVLGLFLLTRSGETTPKATEVVVENVPLPAADAGASAVAETEDAGQAAEVAKTAAPQQKEQENVVLPRQAEPAVPQKKPEPAAIQKKPESAAVVQKKAEPVMPPKKVEPVAAPKKVEPVIVQKKPEPVPTPKKPEPVVAQKKPEPVKAREPVAKPAPQAAAVPGAVAKSDVPLESLMRRPLHFVFTEDMWAEVTDASGAILLSRNVARGTEKWIGGPGHAPYKISISNPRKVKLYYKGNLIDLSAYPATEMAHLTVK